MFDEELVPPSTTDSVLYFFGLTQGSVEMLRQTLNSIRAVLQKSRVHAALGSYRPAVLRLVPASGPSPAARFNGLGHRLQPLCVRGVAHRTGCRRSPLAQ